MNVTIAELHKHLKELGIPDDQYYLHGLYGSSDDNEKLALTIKPGDFNVYFKEFGKKSEELHFLTEAEACDYLFKHIKEGWTFQQTWGKPAPEQ